MSNNNAQIVDATPLNRRNRLLQLSYAELGWLFVIAWLTFTLGMSFFVGDQVASHPIARSYVDWVAQFIPMLDSIKKIPGASQWVRFYYAIMWTVSPLFLGFGWLLRRSMCVQGIYLKHISDFQIAIGFVALLSAGALFLYWPVADGRGWRDGAVVDRIFGVAHFSFCAFGCALLVGGYLRLVYARIRYGTTTEPIFRGE